MKLYIDTSDSKTIKIKLGEKAFEADATINKAQELLPLIIKSLNSQKVDIKEIKEIEVNKGPGSFTGLRIGFSVANALGYAFKISVNGKPVLSNEVEKIDYSS